ncbi:hypothetical protein [Vibrio lentus]|uniref:hypothetical protein n=1 Tax=Vibrio lentus TaxID=136468 RepID=UPI000C821DC9|nr:hypothetical protein [Vibrio lentus]PMH03883.1 hypothetical protein BCU78_01965 [Vibrio lentus]
MKKMKITIIAAALFSVSSAVSSAPMILENLQITNADGSPVAGSQWDDVRFSVDGQPVAFEGVMGENGKNYVYLDGTNATPRSYVDVLVEYGHAKHVARASWSLKTWEDGVLEDDQVDSYSVAGIKGATPYKDSQKSLWLCNFPEIHATGLQPQKVYKPQHLVYLGHNASLALNTRVWNLTVSNYH